MGPQARTVEAVPWRPREILCACDFDPDSAPTAVYAQQLAQAYGARLTILHVEDSEVHMPTELQRMRFDFALTPPVEKGGEYTRRSYLTRLPMLGYTVGGTIADVALEREADLIVIGAHERLRRKRIFRAGSRRR